MLLWHGSRRWDGRPEIREGRKGRSEHGPGIYLTTNLETAWKYAKGGGKLYLFELDDDLELIEGTRVPVQDVLSFLDNLRRVPKRKQTRADVLRNAERFQDGNMPASVLVNLMVNADATSGENGPALAKFLTDHGIDADCVRQSNEDWIILFNPSRAQKWTPMSRTEIPVTMYELPAVCPRNR